MSIHAEQTPGELLAYLRFLAYGAQPAQVFDLRYAPPGRLMRRRFISARQPRQLARRITSLAPTTDVFLGVVLRDQARSGRAAISGARLLYIECDDPAAGQALAGFACPPSLLVASGSPGHLHVYWRLLDRAGALEIESANRRLALALHGEPGCADAGRLLRPPASLNHKHAPARPVTLLRHDPDARYQLAELLAALPADPQPDHALPARSSSRRVGRTALDEQLLAIPAADYVRVLSGREPNRAGKVLCPLHLEADPSLQLYPDGTFYCFGARCHKGGTIFDFAAALWNLETRQDDFLELRRRLAATFVTPTRHRAGC